MHMVHLQLMGKLSCTKKVYLSSLGLYRLYKYTVKFDYLYFASKVGKKYGYILPIPILSLTV